MLECNINSKELNNHNETVETISESFNLLLDTTIRDMDEETEIISLLNGMGLECYLPCFRGIDIKTFLKLKHDDLKLLGIDISTHRKRFVDEILRFHKHEWRSKVVKMDKSNSFTTLEAIHILRNINRQLSVISSSIDFCNYYLQIVEKNENLSLKEKKKLKDEIKDVKNTASQIKNLSFTTKDLAKRLNDKNSDLALPIFIKKKNRMNYKFMAMTLLTAAVGLYFIKNKSNDINFYSFITKIIESH